MSSIARFFLGDSPSQQSIYNPQQQQFLQQYLQTALQGPQSNQGFQGAQNYINRIYDQSPEAFEQFASPYRKEFQENVLPSIANRFGSQGTGGNLDSSAYRNALTGAGSDFTTGLAALRNQLQQNTLPQALNYANAPLNALSQAASHGGLQSPFQNQEGGGGFLSPILAALGASFAGGVGAPAGKALGDQISRWFGGSTKSRGTPLGYSTSLANPGVLYNNDRE